MAIGRTTIRYTKSGVNFTTRVKSGKTTVTRTVRSGKKPRTTVTTRFSNATYTRSY